MENHVQHSVSLPVPAPALGNLPYGISIPAGREIILVGAACAPTPSYATFSQAASLGPARVKSADDCRFSAVHRRGGGRELPMSLLQVIDDTPGYLKATFQGKAGSGKSRTATELGCFTRNFFHSTKPIAFFDTEKGSDYLQPLIEERTGMKPVRVKSRAFSDLMQVVKECLEGASDVLVVDSITHVWRELQESYLASLNRNSKYPKKRMDIQDIMRVKQLWQPWADLFMNANMHILVCGREGAEYGTQEDEETGKRELVQVGQKMKVEGEFAYEGSLMVAMEAMQHPTKIIKRKRGLQTFTERESRNIVNLATVIKDRFDVINGKTFEMPGGEEFLPYLERLRPGADKPVDTALNTQKNMGDAINAYDQEKRERAILCEEIEAALVSAWPGQSAEAKKMKVETVQAAFHTGSWTRVQNLPSPQLRTGLDVIRTKIDEWKRLQETHAA
jgi:hypothetical protein